MLRTRSPDKRILKGILQRPVNLITDIFDSRVLSDDQRLVEIWQIAVALCVDTQQVELLPAPLDNIIDSKVLRTRHDASLWLACQRIEEFEGDSVDLVVGIKTVDVSAVVGKNDVDELINSDVMCSSRIRTSQFSIL